MSINDWFSTHWGNSWTTTTTNPNSYHLDYPRWKQAASDYTIQTNWQYKKASSKKASSNIVHMDEVELSGVDWLEYRVDEICKLGAI